MAHESGELEALAILLLKANNGIPTTNKKGVARLSGRSETTVSRAHWRGELIGSRTTPNGPLVFTIREIAKWLLAGQRYSLPAGPVIEYAEVEDAARHRRKGGRQ